MEPIKVVLAIQLAVFVLRTQIPTIQDIIANVTQDIIEGHRTTRKENVQVF